jgi:hypothetical protein
MALHTPPLQRAWLLVKGKRRAECTVGLDVRGWEVRYEVDAELVRSQVFKTQDGAILDVNDSEIAFKEKGWVEPKK